MPLVISNANAIRDFLERLGKPREVSNSKAIAEAFKVQEHSPDFYFLVYSLSQTFARLLQEIDSADIGTMARQRYTEQVNALANITRLDGLRQRFDVFKKEVISKNEVALTYIDEQLKLTAVLDVETEKEIDRIAAHLERALNDVRQSKLPLRIKATLEFQVGRLLFLLKNYEIASFDQIWEHASAALATMSVVAPHVSGSDDKKVFGSLAVGLTAVVGIIAMVNSGIKDVVSIGKQLKEGYELGRGLKPHP